MVAGVAPGLQIRWGAVRTVLGGFDSHTPPPVIAFKLLQLLGFLRANNLYFCLKKLVFLNWSTNWSTGWSTEGGKTAQERGGYSGCWLFFFVPLCQTKRRDAPLPDESARTLA